MDNLESFMQLTCRKCSNTFESNWSKLAFCSSDCKKDYISSLQEKKCNSCTKVKLIDEFGKQKSNADGYSNQCKACVHERWKLWYDQKGKLAQKNNNYANRKFMKSDKGQPTLHKKRLYRYNLTDAEYKILLAKYDGKCHACQKRPATDIDHDHNTMKVRGLLCSKCNLGIGNLGDTLEDVAAAYFYMLHYQNKN